MGFFSKDKPAGDNGPAWSPVYVPPEMQSKPQSDSAWQASEMSSEHNTAQPSEIHSEYNPVHEIGSSEQNASRPGVVHEMG